MVTRSEYLFSSFSKRQPWRKEGVSRRTWERRRSKRKRAASDEKNLAPPNKRATWRHDEDLVINRIHHFLDTHGMSHSDPEALRKAVKAIERPERFKYMDGRALGKVIRRAKRRLPIRYDHWIGLVETWDRSYTRQKTRELVDRLVRAVGDRQAGILDDLFRHLEQQICDHWPKKVRRLECECERLEKNKYYMPQMRSLKRDEFGDQVYAALADGPKTKKWLAGMFGKTDGAISSVGSRLRKEGKITTIWPGGQFMWARASSTAARFIPAREAIVEALKKGPMTYPALARDTGKAISTIKCALHCHLLKNGTVIRTKFGVYALAGTQSPYVSRGAAIVAALKKGPMTFQAIAREINNPPSSVPQFLEPLLEKGTVIRIGRGIYALRGSAPLYVPTCDAIFSALKKPMKLGPLVQNVIKSTKGNRSRGTIRTVLSRLVEQGTIKHRRWGEYRLARRMRAMRG